MSNNISISNDSINVYYIGSVNSGMWIKYFLYLLLFSLPFGIISFNFSDSGDIMEIIGMLCILISLIFLIPFLRYFLWNVYGEESFNINNKNITRQLNFGFIQTAPRIYTHSGQLSFNYEVIRETEKLKEGIIHFFTYDRNNQPYSLISTSVYMTPEDYEILIENIQFIFDVNQPKEVPFYLN